ncbi:hypothetical protein [Bradyrhizobium commune]|uniref:Uncharacterized protein n=1 Tax=Bradyrhizobium commune TaxID=83627 RepID=A0A7S9D5A5_9BRAD|nr:hypothetical protein [Bradyrhizobium commune]QPF91466.1 hypothetical protein IC761_34355 [Bradyrhizobium commune]
MIDFKSLARWLRLRRVWRTALGTTAAATAFVAAIAALTHQLDDIAGFWKHTFSSKPTKITIKEVTASEPYFYEAVRYVTYIRFIYSRTGSEKTTCVGELEPDGVRHTSDYALEEDGTQKADKRTIVLVSEEDRDVRAGFRFVISTAYFSNDPVFRLNCNGTITPGVRVPMKNISDDTRLRWVKIPD